MPAYNLVDEPWLTLRPLEGGGPVQVSLADALLRAETFEGLVVELPTQLPAVLRHVLLPVVVDALGAPKDRQEWKARFAQEAFTKDERDGLRAYLEVHRSRFDIFDGTAPFAQAGGLRTAKDETKGSAVLVASAASGNNVPLFSSRTDADPLELTPAQAIHWLLHAQCWDTAAIKTGAAGDGQVKAGKTTGNPTGPLGQLGVIVPIGATLYDTLLLNTPITPPGRVGSPQWTRQPVGPTWAARAADGLLDLWTWQSRRIRLIPHDTEHGQRVARVVISAGDRLTAIPEWEPHTAWSLTAPGKKATARPTGERRPRRHAAGKAAWRGLDALLAPIRESGNGFETSVLLDQLAALQDVGAIPPNYPLQIDTSGMLYGIQSAVVEDVLHDTLPLPLLALRQDTEAHDFVLEAAEQAEKLAQAVNNLSADLRRAIGADPIPWDRGHRPGEVVLHALDPIMRRLLAGVQKSSEDPDRIERGQLGWEEHAWRATWLVASPLFDAVPAKAFRGREIRHSDGNTKSSVYSLGTAEANFRRQLSVILPRQDDARRERAAARRAYTAAQATPIAGV